MLTFYHLKTGSNDANEQTNICLPMTLCVFTSISVGEYSFSSMKLMVRIGLSFQRNKISIENQKSNIANQIVF